MKAGQQWVMAVMCHCSKMSGQELLDGKTAERWVMVGMPVAGKQLGCRTVFEVEAQRVDMQEWVLGKAAVFVVADSVVAVVAVVEK